MRTLAKQNHDRNSSLRIELITSRKMLRQKSKMVKKYTKMRERGENQTQMYNIREIVKEKCLKNA